MTPPDDELPPPPRSSGDVELIDAIGAHLDEHVGQCDMVFDEIVSPYVHVDVHMVLPSERSDFITLCTSGCAERPMVLPPNVDDEWAYAEFCCLLPNGWRLDTESFEDERWFFPLRWLKSLARYPHEHSTWLCFGHTVSGIQDESASEARHPFRGLVLMPPYAFPPAFHNLNLPGRPVRIWQMIPLLADEYDFARTNGSEEFIHFIDTFASRHGYAALCDIRRRSLLT